MTHITSTFDRLHAIDIAHMLMKIQGLWPKSNNIPDYTNMMEESQRKSQQGGMPITDLNLVAIATQSQSSVRKDVGRE